jgi:hypothetical protein
LLRHFNRRLTRFTPTVEKLREIQPVSKPKVARLDTIQVQSNLHFIDRTPLDGVIRVAREGG